MPIVLPLLKMEMKKMKPMALMMMKNLEKRIATTLATVISSKRSTKSSRRSLIKSWMMLTPDLSISRK